MRVCIKDNIIAAWVDEGIEVFSRVMCLKY